MRHTRATRYAILLAIAILTPVLFANFVPKAHGAGTTYYLTPVPPFTQEGYTITLDLVVIGALPSTTYQFVFVVKDPSGKNWTSSVQTHNTTSTESVFFVPVIYPSTSFIATGTNSLCCVYHAQVNQIKPIPVFSVASTPFDIILTDKGEYQRTETVNIHATGYNASESVSVTIRTFTTSTLVFTQAINATSAAPKGVVAISWKIPRNATLDTYVLTLTGKSTVKSAPDLQGFTVKAATMSVSALTSTKTTYQRTETMGFSFQPVYPDGSIATTGVALLTLARPSGANITLTAAYDSTANDFSTLYKTTFNNQTGTWTATLQANAYGDGYGNAGPSARLTSTPQLIAATFTINVNATTYVAIGQQVKFNATITYPDGTALQSGLVGAYMLYSGSPTVNETFPTPIFDTGLKVWIDSYTPKSTDPGGPWSLFVKASDSPTPANSGSATKAVTLQDRPPVASFTATPSTAPTATPISFNGTSSYDTDGTVVTYTWAFGDGAVGSGSVVNHAYTYAGSYIVTLTVTDNGGVTGSAPSTVTITDRPPAVSFMASPSTANTGQTVTLSITSYDADGTISTTKVAWGDGSVDSLTGAATSDTHSYASTGALTSQIFTVTITVTDNSGSFSSVSSQVTINDRAPSVSFNPSSTIINTGQNVTLTISAADPDGTVTSRKVDWGDGAIDSLPGSATIDTHSYSTTGAVTSKMFTIVVSATDNSGSIGSYSSQVTVSDRAPVLTFTATPASLSTGQTVSVSITSSDPDGTVSATKVDWSDGTIDTLTGAPTLDTHIYTSAGSASSKTYAITITVTDNSGSTFSKTSQITISDRPPSVSFSLSSTTPTAGQTITVSMTSSDPDGTITATRVDWGDGTVDMLTGAPTSDGHTYTSAGTAGSKTYNVTITVTDNSGQTASNTSTLTVQPASTSSSSGNVSFPLYYFAILAAVIAAILAGGFLAFRRHRVTSAKLKIDLEAVRSEAGRIENQEFFQSVKDQLRKDKDD